VAAALVLLLVLHVVPYSGLVVGRALLLLVLVVLAAYHQCVLSLQDKPRPLLLLARS
jgi:hypothetical protein